MWSWQIRQKALIGFEVDFFNSPLPDGCMSSCPTFPNVKNHRIRLLNIHEVLCGKPQPFACSSYTRPSRCCWLPLQGELYRHPSDASLCQKTQLSAQEKQRRAWDTGLPHRSAADTRCLKYMRLRQNVHTIQIIWQSSPSEKSQEHKVPPPNFCTGLPVLASSLIHPPSPHLH